MNYSVDKNNKELIENIESSYYGQWETDRVIESYFDKEFIGNCIEVGAADGIKGSNTKYFEERGWNVLCIEPNIAYKKVLEKNRNFVLYYAVGNKNTESELTVFNIGKNNIMSSLTSLSPDERLIKDHSHIINKQFKIKIEVRTLDWILKNEVKDTVFENNTYIDFISIDTEGTELDVLKGFDFKKYTVKLFVVENNYNDSNIEEYMKKVGYKKDNRYKINDFYIKDR